MSKKSPKEEGEEDSRDDADFEWKQIETAFKNDAFILLDDLNGAIREELFSIYRSSAYAAQKEHSKFVIAWEAFAAKKGNDNDESFKSNPTKSISENIESFREYIRDEDLMQKEMKNVKKSSSKKKVRSRFEKQAQKKQRVMTMGDALETHDFTEELPNVVVPVEEQKEDEPKTPFKETNNINNNIPLMSNMKTPGSYRKSKKTNNGNNNNTLMKTIFEGGLQENDFVEQKLCSYTEIVDTTTNNNNIEKKFFMRDRIEDKVAFLLNKKKNIIEEEEEKKKSIWSRMLKPSRKQRITPRIINERRKNKVRVERRRNKRVLFVSWTDCQMRRRESEWTLLCREGDRLLSPSLDKKYKNKTTGNPKHVNILWSLHRQRRLDVRAVRRRLTRSSQQKK